MARGGLEPSAIARGVLGEFSRIFTSEIAEDDWERGWGKSSKKAETRKYMRGSGRYADVFLVKEHRPRSYILFIFYFYLFYSSNS